ncbi:diguanylate cyclase [Vibrio chagasii]|nr:diguanylate cyclase [Vibrio chagasii]
MSGYARVKSLLSAKRDALSAFALLDINSFKAINDQHGNYIGDKVLQFVAETLRRTLPENNLTFRTAGNEFAFINYTTRPNRHLVEQILAKNQTRLLKRSTSRSILRSVLVLPAQKETTRMSSRSSSNNLQLSLKECKQSPDTHIQCYDTHLRFRYQRKAELIAALGAKELENPISNNLTPDGNGMYVVASAYRRPGENRREYLRC